MKPRPLKERSSPAASPAGSGRSAHVPIQSSMGAGTSPSIRCHVLLSGLVTRLTTAVCSVFQAVKYTTRPAGGAPSFFRSVVRAPPSAWAGQQNPRTAHDHPFQNTMDRETFFLVREAVPPLHHRRRFIVCPLDGGALTNDLLKFLQARLQPADLLLVFFLQNAGRQFRQFALP